LKIKSGSETEGLLSVILGLKNKETGMLSNPDAVHLSRKTVSYGFLRWKHDLIQLIQIFKRYCSRNADFCFKIRNLSTYRKRNKLFEEN
jgi:hypothetical protein